MSKIEAVEVGNLDGPFGGFIKVRDGKRAGTYVAVNPMPIAPGSTVFVELLSPDRCKVLHFREPQPRTKPKPRTPAENAAVLAASPDDVFHQGDMERELSIRQLAARLLKSVAGRDAYVIHCRFFRDETLQALTKRLGVSKDRVRQIEARALRRMRAAVHRDGLDDAYMNCPA